MNIMLLMDGHVFINVILGLTLIQPAFTECQLQAQAGVEGLKNIRQSSFSTKGNLITDPIAGFSPHLLLIYSPISWRLQNQKRSIPLS